MYSQLIQEIKRRILEDYNTGDEEYDAIAQGALASLLGYAEGQQKMPKDLRKESQEYLKTLSESPYNNTPVTNVQAVVRELVNFLDRPASYDPDHVSGETCTLEGWVARDCFRGNICLFEHKPIRPSEQDLGIWKCHGSVLHLPKEAFPKLRWEDEPVKVKLTITPKTT